MQYKTITILIIFMLLTAFDEDKSILAEQKKFERVRSSINEKETQITTKLKELGISKENLNILLVAFKAEEKLEIYAKNQTESTYKKLITYKICSSSGQLGPKRMQGDLQVPEGFYHINRFNPTSNFYLSLGINYPNESDRKKSTAHDLGGEIFIHGSCVTIGCLPMTDDKIKEIYLYALYARNNGQTKIPVYIFPFIMTDKNYEIYKSKFQDNPDLIEFWSNLKTGFEKFEVSKKELSVDVDLKGNYLFL